MHFQGQKNNDFMWGATFFSPPKISYIFFIIFLSGIFFTGWSQQVIIENNNTKTIITSKSKHKIKHHGDGNSFNIEHKGNISVSDDDRDVTSISSGGYLEIDKTTFGSKRSVIIEQRSSGLSKQYYEGRKEQPWDPYGKEWLAEILPDIVRSTSIAAKDRVDRFYRKGGAPRVLEEINEIDSDHVKTTYFNLLLKKKGLSSTDLINILEEIEDEVRSDHYQAQLLEDNSSLFLQNENVTRAYFDVVSDIGSSHYASSVLKEALRETNFSDASFVYIIKASKDIDSDYHQAELLSEALEVRGLTDEVISEIIRAAQEVRSDYYQAKLLKKAMELDNLSSESLEEIIVAISDVSSDYYMASVFSDLLEEQLNEQVQLKIINLIEDEMSSDYYAAAVLSKALEEQQLSDQVTRDLAGAIGDINSSSYASSIIKKAASNKLTKATLLTLLDTIEEINSDYYRSEALIALAPQVRDGDSELKEAYRQAAKSIHSDTYYGKTMRALD